ncbi:MAG: AAA family ATPase, partial [Halobacteriovoraceae bacterium]|nr:AAA family ATPase [Halobacteriovoraceae bacterium]
MRIKSIRIKNFRGIRQEIELDADSESVLLYGDNGTGKSSFLDAIEWFITDKVSHLSSREIEKYGGLRNILSNEEEESFVELKFNSNLKNIKKLEVKNKKFKSFFANKDEKIISVINEIKNEHLWIRNRELVDFIIKSKSERLADISNIIGYNEVSKVKKALKKSVYDIGKAIEIKNFSSAIAEKKGKIAEKLGQMVNNTKQFYSAINEKLKKQNLKINVTNEKSLEVAISELKSPVDEKELKLRHFLEGVKNKIISINSSARLNSKNFKNYLEEARDIQNDAENMKNISLIRLYQEAKKALEHHNEDNCPLCLLEIKKEDLLKSISSKLDKLRLLEEKISKIIIIKSEIAAIIQ